MRNQIDTEAMARDPAERELLRLARDPSIQRLEVILRDGRLERGYATQELEVGKADAVQELLDAEPYQSLELIRHAGAMMRVVRRLPIKFPRAEPPRKG